MTATLVGFHGEKVETPYSCKKYKIDPKVCTVQEFNPEKCSKWIFDYGATCTMTHDRWYIVYWLTPHKKEIQTTNGSITPVVGADTIIVSPTLKVSNCLYVSSLSCILL